MGDLTQMSKTKTNFLNFSFFVLNFLTSKKSGHERRLQVQGADQEALPREAGGRGDHKGQTARGSQDQGGSTEETRVYSGWEC